MKRLWLYVSPLLLAAGMVGVLFAADTNPTPPPSSSTTAKQPTKPAEKIKVCIIPICGPIRSSAFTRAIEDALGEAKKSKCSVVVFRMNTPGGRIDLASRIIDLIQGVDWASTVAWVNGDEHESLSAGAFISLSTKAIFMSPGSTIGAAVPFTATTSGSLEIDAKFQSAFRAKFRALAQKNGYPSLLVDAMVNSGTSIVQIWLDGKQMLVTEEDATALANDHRGDGKFKRGKTINRAGQILTLTSDEAIEYGLSKAICKDEAELLKAMELGDCVVTEANPKWIPDEAISDSTPLNAVLGFLKDFEMVLKTDPTRVLSPEKRGTPSWTTMRSKCLEYLTKCQNDIAMCMAEAERRHAAWVSQQEAYQRHLFSGPPPSEPPLVDGDELRAQLEPLYRRLGATP